MSERWWKDEHRSLKERRGRERRVIQSHITTAFQEIMIIIIKLIN